MNISWWELYWKVLVHTELWEFYWTVSLLNPAITHTSPLITLLILPSKDSLLLGNFPYYLICFKYWDLLPLYHYQLLRVSFIYPALVISISIVWACYIQTYNDFKQLLNFMIFSLIVYILISILPVTSASYFDYYENLGFFKDEFFIYIDISINLQIFISILTICLLISSYDYFKNESNFSKELPIIMLFSLTGVFSLISSNHFFVTYLAIELQSLALYVLAASKRYSNLSIEAALRYFILGSFASCLLLFGISFIYGAIGSLSLNNFCLLLTYIEIKDTYTYGSVLFGSILFTIGMLFKLGVVPFHYWLPDVYEGVPLIIVYFYSIIPKISILYFLLRVYLLCII